MSDLIAQIREAFPEFAEVIGRMQSVFAQVEIAEEEIEQAARTATNDMMRDIFYGSFATMETPYGAHLPAHIYREHVRELLERIRTAKRLTPTQLSQATLAEVKLELMHSCKRVSLYVPLNAHAGALYAAIFQEFYPEWSEQIDFSWVREPWEGAVAQLINQARRSSRSPVIPRPMPAPRRPPWVGEFDDLPLFAPRNREDNDGPK